HANNINIGNWPSGKAPFRTATADGQLTKGSLSNFRAVAPDATGRLGVLIDSAHTDLAIDTETVTCNAPAGKFHEVPPKYRSRTAEQQYRVIVSSGVKTSHTGDTNETDLKTVTIPGGAIGPNGSIRIR